MILLESLKRVNYCSPTEWRGFTVNSSNVRIMYEKYYFAVIVNDKKIHVRQLKKPYLEDLTYTELIDLTKHLFDFSNVIEEQFAESYCENIDFCIKKRELVDKPIEELVERTNCNLLCIEKNSCGSCGCHLCAKKNGYFYRGEIFIRKRLHDNDVRYISPSNDQLIKDLFDETLGYFRKDGCCLPRKIRSETCLRYTCDEFIKYEMKRETND